MRNNIFYILFLLLPSLIQAEDIVPKEIKALVKTSLTFKDIYDEDYVTSIGVERFVRLMHLEGMSFRTVESGSSSRKTIVHYYEYVKRDTLGNNSKVIEDEQQKLKLKKDCDTLREVETSIIHKIDLSEDTRKMLFQNNLGNKDVLLFMRDIRNQVELVKSRVINDKEYESLKDDIVSLSENDNVLEKHESGAIPHQETEKW